MLMTDSDKCDEIVEKMASTIQQLLDLSELVEFFKAQNLYLKPISRITVTVQLPVLKDPNKIISNWDIIEKLKRLVAPAQFTTIKVSKSSLEFVRFEAEFDNRDLMLRALKILDNANLKMIGFFDTFKVKAAEAKSEFPTRYAWDSFFRDAANMDETRPGERPDTVRLEKLPCKWFQGYPTSLDFALFRSVLHLKGYWSRDSAVTATEGIAVQPPQRYKNFDENFTNITSNAMEQQKLFFIEFKT
uniref:Uncharacterized protein n=1 Tax=Romanomermis culicivorax TaxID=13658 RepID=A0A915IMZ7_ROMCU